MSMSADAFRRPKGSKAGHPAVSGPGKGGAAKCDARRNLAASLFPLVLGLAATAAQAGKGSWSVGIRFGVPLCGPPCGYRPCYGWGYGLRYYPRVYPVYVEPAPMLVQPPPVIVQPPPVLQSAPPLPTTAPAVAQTTAAQPNTAEVDRHLQLLANPDEQVRADSVMQLGRLRAERAVEPLTATLAGDRSPMVREAAARALGLIGSPRGLTALKRAVVADNERDVRYSCQFAIDVIQTGR